MNNSIRFLKAVCFLPAASFFVLVAGAQAPETGKGLTWAFPVPDAKLPAIEEDGKPRQLPGSTRSYTQEQIDDQFNPPDWYPNEHKTPPSIILKGIKPNVQACGSCHLMSGLGHPESANLAGLPFAYLQRQMADFKSNDRKDPPLHAASLRAARMNGISKAISDEDARQASEWFSSLKPAPWYTVEEAQTVPKSYVNNTRMRLPLPAGGTEPIGNRIVVLPRDQARIELRDPHLGFIAYVPPGSVAKGKALVENGGSGKTISCSICHGDELKGLGEVPALAGQNPLYIARQLYNFQSGAHDGASAALMKKVVAKLSESDIVEIAAYLSSLTP
jgi:cytochrome c553